MFNSIALLGKTPIGSRRHTTAAAHGLHTLPIVYDVGSLINPCYFNLWHQILHLQESPPSPHLPPLTYMIPNQETVFAVAVF